MADDTFPGWHGTTILAVRRGGQVVVAGDGQVSLGNTVIKGTARKVRRLNAGGHEVVCGFAGSTADAFTLLERLEKKLEATPGQLARACVELAKDWRMDKYLRNLEAMLIVTDGRDLLVLTGAGDVLEPEHDVAAIGSGGNYALAAARGLMSTELDAETIARKAMAIAADICVYTNGKLTVRRSAPDCSGTFLLDQTLQQGHAPFGKSARTQCQIPHRPDEELAIPLRGLAPGQQFDTLRRMHQCQGQDLAFRPLIRQIGIAKENRLRGGNGPMQHFQLRRRSLGHICTVILRGAHIQRPIQPRQQRAFGVGFRQARDGSLGRCRRNGIATMPRQGQTPQRRIPQGRVDRWHRLHWPHRQTHDSGPGHQAIGQGATGQHQRGGQGATGAHGNLLFTKWSGRMRATASRVQPFA